MFSLFRFVVFSFSPFFSVVHGFFSKHICNIMPILAQESGKLNIIQYVNFEGDPANTVRKKKKVRLSKIGAKRALNTIKTVYWRCSKWKSRQPLAGHVDGF